MYDLQQLKIFREQFNDMWGIKIANAVSTNKGPAAVH